MTHKSNNTINAFWVIFLLLFGTSCKERIKVNSVPIKAEDLLDWSFKNVFALSDDGSWIAYTENVSGQIKLSALDVNNNKIFLIPFPKGGQIRQLKWTKSNKLLFTIIYPGEFRKHLFAIEPGQINPINLSPFENAVVRNFIIPENNEDEVLVIMSHRSNQYFDAYRINLFNGSSKMVGKNNGNFSTFLPDNDGNVLCAISIEGKISSLWHRENENLPFKRIFTTSFYERIQPIKFTRNNKYIYALSTIGRDKRALVVIDPKTGKEIKEIYKNKEVDISTATFENGMLQFIDYHSDKPKQVLTNPIARKTFSTIKDSNKDQIVEITDVSNNQNAFIFKVWSDINPGTYWYFNNKTNNKIQFNFLKPVYGVLSQTIPIKIKNRDGFFIPCYITIPANGVRSELPAIVIPNSGYSTRHFWNFDPQTQFFASRGYLVLQVNFHGSNGYGIRYAQGGYKELNNKILSDIADALNYLVANGYTNYNQICLLGENIGGLIALNFASKYPESVQCVISRDGILDLFKILKTAPDRMLPYKDMLAELFGNPISDSILVAQSSPINQLKNCIRPILIAQSNRDQRNSDETIKSVKQIFEKNQIPFQFVQLNNDLPHKQKIEDQAAYLKTVEKFLQLYLY